ncbi:MAG: DPP IV N-terminal domain-containing protein [Bacteroidales bacterium]|nr:DPP IV N-terminal domain-containing protein [Bacteroidales bacterium]
MEVLEIPNTNMNKMNIEIKSTKFLLAFTLTICNVIISASAQNSNLSLSDIWKDYIFYPKTNNYFFINDTNLIAHLKENKLYINQLNNFSINDSIDFAQTTETIHDIVDGYKYGKLLLAVDKQQQFRRSYYSSYIVYDIENNSWDDFADNKKIRLASFSPNCKYNSYFFENNLFIEDAKKETTAITNDGCLNKIINGAPDWVYEEEFELKKAYWWSPDSKQIAYLKFDETAVSDYNIDKYDSVYPQRFTYKYPKAGTTNSNVSAWIYNLETKSTKQITIPVTYEYLPVIQWFTNETVLLQCFSRFQDTLNIFAYNTNKNSIAHIYNETSNTFIPFPNYLTIIDSSSFILLSDKNLNKQIYQISFQKKVIQQITKSKNDIDKIIGFSTNNNCIYYLSSDSSVLEKHLYSFNIKSNATKRISTTSGYHDVEFNNSYSLFIDYYSNEFNKTKTQLCNAEGDIIKTLESSNFVDELHKKHTIADKQFFTFTNKANDTLYGFMVKPEKMKKNHKYPVLLTVYGGPSIQRVTKEYDYMLYWYNYLAKKGIITIAIDPRGTGNRGNQFNKITHGKLGQIETEDIIAGIEYIEKLPYVNPQKIAMQGWSYGGYLTLLSMCKTSKICAGIAVAPVTDWRFYNTIYTERYMKTPQLNTENYNKSSVVENANSLQGNLLLIHGSFDDNVHIQNSHTLAKKLIGRAFEFDYFVYPDKNHNLSGGATRFHLYNKMTDFLIKNLNTED